MLRPGLKGGQSKYANMNGWGLAVLGWCKGGDCELGPDQMYLALHKKEKKFSIWTSRIFATPPEVFWEFEHLDDFNDSEGLNDTDSNSTDNATATAPAAPAAAPAAAAPATPAAASSAEGNSTNGTNASKKKKAKKPKKKKLPVPYAGDNSDDDAAGADLSWDIDEEEDFGDYEWRDKINHATEMYELPGGFMHVKFLKWLKLFDDDE